MKRFLWVACLTLLCGLMVGCCPCRDLTSSETTQRSDSTRVEYRERTVYVPDTILVEIPLQTSERIATDSVSHLENDYAISDVRLLSNGTIYHHLSTKPQLKPVRADREVTVRDSIVYRYRVVNHTKTKVIEKKLTFLQKAQIWGCRGLIILLAITYTVWRFRTHRERIREK